MLLQHLLQTSVLCLQVINTEAPEGYISKCTSDGRHLVGRVQFPFASASRVTDTRLCGTQQAGQASPPTSTQHSTNVLISVHVRFRFIHLHQVTSKRFITTASSCSRIWHDMMLQVCFAASFQQLVVYEYTGPVPRGPISPPSDEPSTSAAVVGFNRCAYPVVWATTHCALMCQHCKPASHGVKAVVTMRLLAQ